MKKGVFTLGGPLKGRTMIILDKYSFVDGVMKVSATDALLMKAILCGSYGAVLTFEGSDEAAPAVEGEDGSLSVNSTRGLTEGEKMQNSAMSAMIDHAVRLDQEEQAMASQRAEEQARLDAQLAGETKVEAAPVPAKAAAPAAEAKK